MVISIETVIESTVHLSEQIQQTRSRFSVLQGGNRQNNLEELTSTIASHRASRDTLIAQYGQLLGLAALVGNISSEYLNLLNDMFRLIDADLTNLENIQKEIRQQPVNESSRKRPGSPLPQERNVKVYDLCDFRNEAPMDLCAQIASATAAFLAPHAASSSSSQEEAEGKLKSWTDGMANLAKFMGGNFQHNEEIAQPLDTAEKVADQKEIAESVDTMHDMSLLDGDLYGKIGIEQSLDTMHDMSLLGGDFFEKAEVKEPIDTTHDMNLLDNDFHEKVEVKQPVETNHVAAPQNKTRQDLLIALERNNKLELRQLLPQLDPQARESFYQEINQLLLLEGKEPMSQELIALLNSGHATITNSIDWEMCIGAALSAEPQQVQPNQEQPIEPSAPEVQQQQDAANQDIFAPQRQAKQELIAALHRNNRAELQQLFPRLHPEIREYFYYEINRLLSRMGKEMIMDWLVDLLDTGEATITDNLPQDLCIDAAIAISVKGKNPMDDGE